MQDFEPPRLLRSPHVQSVMASSGLRRARIVRAARELLDRSEDVVAEAGDGVRLLAHHTPPQQAAAGTALLIHGWEGSAGASYMLSAAYRLWSRGFRVVRLNLRDHGDSHHLNPELFHSCRLDEVAGAVSWAQRRFAGEPLVLGGFSLGGNFVLRIAARAGDYGLDLARVAAVCPVLDPAETMRALDDGWLGYRLYFLRKWRRSLERKRAAFPERYDFGDLRRFRSLEAMTEYFVERYTEFPSLDEYLAGYALTGERLRSLRVPSRLLLADDDPVIPVSGADRLARPPALVVDRARFGGHCGFLGDMGGTSPVDDYLLEVLAGSGRRERG